MRALFGREQASEEVLAAGADDRLAAILLPDFDRAPAVWASERGRPLDRERLTAARARGNLRVVAGKDTAGFPTRWAGDVKEHELTSRERDHYNIQEGPTKIHCLAENNRRDGAWFKKGSGTVVRSTLRAVPATVPDPFLNHVRGGLRSEAQVKL